MDQVFLKSPKKLELKWAWLAQRCRTQSKLRGTKPSRTCGMCPRLQKHSDWWVWITQQYIPLCKSGFTLFKGDFSCLFCTNFPFSKREFSLLLRRFLRRHLFKKNRISAKNSQAEVCLLLSLFMEVFDDESHQRFVSLHCYLSFCRIEPDNRTSDKQQKPYRGVKPVCSMLMPRNWGKSYWNSVPVGFSWWTFTGKKRLCSGHPSLFTGNQG